MKNNYLLGTLPLNQLWVLFYHTCVYYNLLSILFSKKSLNYSKYCSTLLMFISLKYSILQFKIILNNGASVFESFFFEFLTWHVDNFQNFLGLWWDARKVGIYILKMVSPQFVGNSPCFGLFFGSTSSYTIP